MSDPSNAPDALHVVFDGAHEGAHNLALDEALLDARELGVDAQWLRFYGWKPHTVSLGYFQPISEFADVEAPVVRRCTGGGAILHADEITFALACDARVLPKNVDASYQLVNEAITEAAGQLGAALSPPPAASQDETRWCFAKPTGLDLVDPQGLKVVGSAQRRRHGRVLHHGSIVLAQPPGQNFCGAIDVDGNRLCTRIADALLSRLQLLHIERRESFPPPVLARAAELRRTRYDAPEWLAKR